MNKSHHYSKTNSTNMLKKTICQITTPAEEWLLNKTAGRDRERRNKRSQLYSILCIYMFKLNDCQLQKKTKQLIFNPQQHKQDNLDNNEDMNSYRTSSCKVLHTLKLSQVKKHIFSSKNVSNHFITFPLLSIHYFVILPKALFSLCLLPL
jgi:hypothetical protein